jgi:hypothetical protein
MVNQRPLPLVTGNMPRKSLTDLNDAPRQCDTGHQPPPKTRDSKKDFEHVCDSGPEKPVIPRAPSSFGEVWVTEGLSGLKIQSDGGITHVPAATDRDPFEALDDLMTVIEALCPVWPHREIFSSADRFLI